MSAKSRGTARERQWAKRQEADGWTVVRGAGSLGAADLIELQRSESGIQYSRVRLMQVKANKGSPWMNFRPAERAKLVALARKIGAVALMVHWPPYGNPTIYPPSEWPEFYQERAA